VSCAAWIPGAVHLVAARVLPSRLSAPGASMACATPCSPGGVLREAKVRHTSGSGNGTLPRLGPSLPWPSAVSSRGVTGVGTTWTANGSGPVANGEPFTGRNRSLPGSTRETAAQVVRQPRPLGPDDRVPQIDEEGVILAIDQSGRRAAAMPPTRPRRCRPCAGRRWEPGDRCA
jgi:hypothetical protein